MRALLRALAVAIALVLPCAGLADPLPSWTDGAAKRAIVAFVDRATKPGTPDFVAPSARIAVFDNDGTLWSEQPLYFQLAFAIDRIKAMAPQHPEWSDTEPYQSVLANDLKGILAGGEKAIVELVMATHAGMTTDEFAATVADWARTAVHPRWKRPYTECIYQPMLEVLAYLRSNGFKNYIVSGGGVAFMRVFAREVYGIPPEQVIGSTIEIEYEVRDGTPALVRQPALRFIDDKAGKPVAIHARIGRRPIAAFGNSDGDFQMLEWTTSGKGARFGLIVHHDDAEREWAYDRESHIGKLDRGLDEAPRRGWTVVSMKHDWKSIYPPAAP